MFVIAIASYKQGQLSQSTNTAPEVQSDYKSVTLYGNLSSLSPISFEVPVSWNVAESGNNQRSDPSQASTLYVANEAALTVSPQNIGPSSNQSQAHIFFYEGDVRQQIADVLSKQPSANISRVSALVTGRTAEIYSDAANGADGNETYIFTTKDGGPTVRIFREGTGSDEFQLGFEHMLQTLSFE